jgi:hypothetical protein
MPAKSTAHSPAFGTAAGRLGDEMNGFAAETNVATLDEAARFLDIQAHIHYPNSSFALGFQKQPE